MSKSKNPGVDRTPAPERSTERPPAAPEPDTVRRELDRACRRLRLRPDAEARIPAIVSVLMDVALTSPGKTGELPAVFSPIGRKTCERELAVLTAAATRLADALEQLHEPTVLALAQVGFAASQRRGLPDMLRAVGDQAKRADVSEVALRSGRGRRPDRRSEAVARIAGSAYRSLTGKRPTYTTDPTTSRRSGNWPAFLQAIFAAIGIEGAGDHWARTVADKMRMISDGTVAVRSR